MSKKKQFYAICLLVMSVIFSSCEKVESVNSVISDGAETFKEGKEETEYAFISSEEVLNNLIREFSGSRSTPSGTVISDADAGHIQDIVDDDSIIGTIVDDVVTPDNPDITAVPDATVDPGTIEDPDMPDESEDPSGNETKNAGDTETLQVGSRQDLKDLLHRMYDETKEVSVFQCVNNYQMDINEMEAILLELEREDAFDTICLNRYGYNTSGTNTIVQFKYHMEVEELRQMKEETRILLEQAERQISVEGLSDYEIVCAVNDYLCDTIVYPAQEPYAPETHTAYSAFKHGSAVCDGYSRAAKLLLNEFGIECDMVVGVCTDGGGHAWNFVKLDNAWYHMDVTWNDGGAKWDENARKEYLLVTDDFMRHSRTWDTTVYPASSASNY